MIGAVMLVAGCGPQSASNTLPGMAQLRQSGSQTANPGSIATANLLYVSDFNNSRILVYRYRQGKRATVFQNNFIMLDGVCADATGNVCVLRTYVSGSVKEVTAFRLRRDGAALGHHALPTDRG
jgi:sugar lactone lactonase YvrE